MSVNKVILIGNTGKDPVITKIESGTIAKISLATSENYKDKQGQKVEKTEWHQVVFFGKLAEIVEKYVKKGDKIYIEGKIETRQYEKEGQKHYSTQINAKELKMLGQKESNQPEAPQVDDENLPF